MVRYRYSLKLIHFKSARHQVLENRSRVILLRNTHQTLVIVSAIAREDGLEARRIAHVVERVIQACLLRGIVNRIRGFLDPLHDSLVVLGASPLHHLSIGEIHLARLQAQRVAAGLGGGVHPQLADGLPVELDGLDVVGGDLVVQGRQAVEEGAVDDADAAVQLVEGLAGDGAGDEDITI